jgi:hypothetical protein
MDKHEEMSNVKAQSPNEIQNPNGQKKVFGI